MSKKANPTAIGTFVLSALALTILAIAVFGSGRWFEKSEPYVLYFSDSVGGLNPGAPVKYKGVQIGRVTDIRIRYNQPNDSDHIPVFIEIDTDRLAGLGVEQDISTRDALMQQISIGMRARLEMQNYLAGLLYIELDYYHDQPVILVQEGGELKEIPTAHSNIAAILEATMQTLAGVSQIDFAGISKDVRSLAQEVERAIASVDFKNLSDSLVDTADEVNAIFASGEVRQAIVNFSAVMASVEQLVQNLDNNVNPAADEIKKTFVEVQKSLRSFNSMVDSGSTFRYQLDETLREMSETARNLRWLADSLERQPNVWLTGKHPKDNE